MSNLLETRLKIQSISLRDHPLIYPKIRLVSEVISETNRLLNYKSLAIHIEKAAKGSENQCI